MRAAALALAAVLVLAPACGADGTDMTEAAAIQLDSQVQDLRQAAAGGSREAASHELADLRGLVDELSTAGELGEDRARRILAAAAEVEANLELLATTTTPAVTTTIPAATTTDPPPSPTTTEEKPDKGKNEETRGGKDDDDKDDKDDEEKQPPPGNENRVRD